MRNQDWVLHFLAVVVLAILTIGLTAAPIGTVAAQQSHNPAVGSVDLSGSGTQTDPYVITNISELQAVDNDLEAHYILDTDINAANTTKWNGGKGFEPIGGTRSYQGSFPPSFNGSLNGNGHTVSGLLINRSNSDNSALFSWIGDSGSVSNISIQNATVTGSIRTAGLVGVNDGKITTATVTGEITGSDDVGGLVASNNGIVHNSSANTTVSATDSFLSGFVGSNKGTITSSSATGTVNGSVAASNGTNYVGGLVAINQGQIRNSTTRISINGSYAVGGLVGWNVRGTIINGSVNGSVNGSTNTGGLVGRNQNATIESSLSDTSVDGNLVTGGLVGRNHQNSIIRRSSADGSVEGTFSVGNTVGGLVGYNDNSQISNASTTASVSGKNNIGGLAGVNDGNIADTYAVGSVSASSTVGGLIGSNSGSVIDSYWDINATGQSGSAGGTGLSTSQMIGTAARMNMSGLSFNSVWASLPNTYPKLRQRPINSSNNSSSNNSNYLDVDPSDLTGAGTSNDPYIISNVSELQAMEDGLSAHYRLGNDINASQTKQWNNGSGFDPVGSLKSEFTGSLTAANFTISGLYINRPTEDFVGMIGYAGKGARITGIDIELADVTGSDRVGGLVGQNNHGTVSTVYTNGTISGSAFVGGLVGLNVDNATVNASNGVVNVSGGDAIGGLVGLNQDSAIIENSSATGNVSGINKTSTDIGGLVGANRKSARVYSSYATSSVSGPYSVGGLVGENSNNAIVWSSNASGAVSGSGSVGGLIGSNEVSTATGKQPTVRSSHATGNVYNSSTGIKRSSSILGGLIGKNTGIVTNTYANGNISGDIIGGLIGINGNNGLVNNSHATGNISGSNTGGGLVGSNSGTVRFSYATGTVSISGDEAGGLIAKNDQKAVVTTSYAVGAVSGSDSVGGLVGNQYNGTIRHSYAVGTVYGSEEVGGLIGYNNGKVNASYSKSGVSGSTQVGGLIGENRAIVTDSYATGTVSGTKDVGGLIGTEYTNTTVTDSYWDYISTGQLSSAGGTSVKSYKMTGLAARNNMVGLSFDTVWRPQPNDYPVLIWQTNRGGSSPSNNSAPTAQIRYTPEIVTPETPVTLNASNSTDTDGTIDVYKWDLDGDGITEATGESATYNYSYPGIYSVSLTTIDDDLAVNTTTNIINVSITIDGLSGNGSVTDPYVVTDIYELQAIKEDVSGHYVLRDNISASTTANWYGGAGFDPIGDAQSPFTGTIREKNTTITNITINRSSENYVGLVGYLGSSAVLSGVKIKQANISGKDNVGGLTGTNRGFIRRSYVIGSIDGSTNVGGLVGTNRNKVSSSFTTANVSASRDVGGIVGENSAGSNLTNSYSNGNVSGIDPVGGLVGRNNGFVADSYAVSTVSSKDSAGGVVGENYNTVTDSYYDLTLIDRSTSADGTGLTTTEMTGMAALTNMNGLPFGTLWDTRTKSYPTLIWQNRSSNASTAIGDLTGNGLAAQDLDSDGFYEDINGDGSANLRDLKPFFDIVRPSTPTPSAMALDFNSDGTVDLRDLQPFFTEVRP